MIKDIIETFIKEARNEKNQTNIAFVLEPVLNKIKFSYYVLILILILILINVFYMSVVLHKHPYYILNKI